MNVGLFNNVLGSRLEEYFETNSRSWKIGKDFFTDEYGTSSLIVSYVCAQRIYLLRCVNEYGHLLLAHSIVRRMSICCAA